MVVYCQNLFLSLCVKSLKERFEDKIFYSPCGCWLWTGQTKKGYGRFELADRVRISAHRLSYRIYNGQIPANMVIMHSCDVPLCVNPYHLSVGTVQENNRDAWQKGLHKPNPKLDEIDVRSIKKMAELTDDKDLVARAHSVSIPTINKILRGGYNPKEVSAGRSKAKY
jgi:hypothetical protein